MKPMKERERSVYEYVSKTIRENGYSPSVRDIKEALGFKSTSNVHTYLSRLEERGLLCKESGKSRTLRIGGENEVAPARVPILGNVAAGALSFAEENYDGYVNFCTSPSVDKEALFALRVRGASMKDAGIRMEISTAAKAYLVERGYDPAYGARPLRRTISRLLEDM